MWPALFAAGASLAGGALGADGAKDASRASSKAAQEQLAFQKWLYEQGAARNEPWRATGQGALNSLAQMFGLPYSPYQSPGYGYGGSGGFGSTSKTVGKSGFGDPLPLPDPAGLFGNKGRTAEWGGENLLTAKNVIKLLKQGRSIKEISQLGYLESSLNPRRLKKLAKHGVDTPEEIKRLQGGPAAMAQNGPSVLNPGDAGYKSFDMGEGPPGYNFFREEGQRDIGNSFAARGGAFSGNALRGLTEFNQEYANQKMVNPLMQLAGFGQQSNNTAQAGSNAFGAYGGQAINSMGDARASGIANSANMWGQGLMGAANAFGRYGQQPSQWDQYQYYGNQGWGG